MSQKALSDLVRSGSRWCSSFGGCLKAVGRTAMSLLSASQAATNANMGEANKLLMLESFQTKWTTSSPEI